MTEILLNGKALTIEPGTTIAALVESLGLAGKRIAVECNQEIVPRSRLGETRLASGDRIEIVHAIGGG